MIKNISDKDKKDWENFLKKKENLPDKDNNFFKKKIINEYTYDLHGYSLFEANKKISEIINKSYERGIKKLIIITGKGIHSQNEKNPYISNNLGKLKYSVPDYIKKNNDLMEKISSITDADLSKGGDGAFYIFLKKKL